MLYNIYPVFVVHCEPVPIFALKYVINELDVVVMDDDKLSISIVLLFLSVTNNVPVSGSVDMSVSPRCIVLPARYKSRHLLLEEPKSYDISKVGVRFPAIIKLFS